MENYTESYACHSAVGAPTHLAVLVSCAESVASQQRKMPIPILTTRAGSCRVRSG